MRSNQEANQVPWNIGRIIGPKPPLKPKHIWAIRTRLQHEGRVRDLAMFNVAIDSKLRGCDLVRLRVGDIHLGDSIRLRTTIVQQKTGRPVSFELTEPTREALVPWLKLRKLRGSDWLFPSRSRPGDHLTTRQYGRLLDESGRLPSWPRQQKCAQGRRPAFRRLAPKRTRQKARKGSTWVESGRPKFNHDDYKVPGSIELGARQVCSVEPFWIARKRTTL